MAEETLDATTAKAWEDAYQDNDLDPEDRTFWEGVRQKYVPNAAPVPKRYTPVVDEPDYQQMPGVRRGYTPVADEPPVAQLPSGKLPAAPYDPRANSPWYSQAYQTLTDPGTYSAAAGYLKKIGSAALDPSTYVEAFKRSAQVPGEHMPPGEVPLPETVSTPQGRQVPDTTSAEQSYREGVKHGSRLLLEHAPDAISMVSPAAPAAWVGRVPWVLAKTLPPLVQAGKYYVAQQGATRLANVVDPEHPTDPNTQALYTAAGEGIGRAVAAPAEYGLTRLKEAWKEPVRVGGVGRGGRELGQKEVLQTVEDLGGQSTLGMGSEREWPQWVDVGAAHTPFGGRVRNVYDRSKQLVDEALDNVRGRHPTGKVDQSLHRMEVQTQRMANPQALETVPRGVRKTTEEVIDHTNKFHAQAYDALDTTYKGYQVPWGVQQASLPAARTADDLLLRPQLMQVYQIQPDSIFHRTATLLDEMRNAPAQVTVEQLLDMHKRTDALMREGTKHVQDVEAEAVHNPAAWTELTSSIQKNVLSALADTNHLLYQQLKPYLVDRGPAQALAKKVIGTWETSLEVPEQAMQRGGPGRVGVLEDPQVMAARALLEKPRFALFGEAHADRMQLLKIGRMKGPNLGNQIADEADEMAKAVDASMQATGDGLAPQLTPAWRATNTAYKADAEMLNSPFVMELAEKDLDDILLTSVANGRPNDLKTLRAFLAKHPKGGSTLDDIGEMWLTQKIMARTNDQSKQLDLDGLAADLKQLTPAVEKELFPRGLAAMKDRIKQGIGMQQAVDEIGKGEKASVFRVQQLRNQVRDPALWGQVQSDVLAKILTSPEGMPLDGMKILTALGDMKNISGAVFSPAQLKELTHLAHTSRSLDLVARSGKLNWSPVVRGIEHGLAIGGLTYLTGDPKYAAMYIVGTAGLARILSDPMTVSLLRKMMTTPANTKAHGELLGAFLGQLSSRGMSDAITPVTAGGELPGPRPAAQHHPEDMAPSPAGAW